MTQAPEPLDPAPPNGLDRATAFVEVVLCSGFPTQLALVQLLALAGLHPLDAGGRLSIGYVWTLSLLDAVLLVGLILLFLGLHGESARTMFLGRRPIVHEGLVGLAVTPVIFVLAVGSLALLQTFLPWLHNVPTNPLADLLRTRVGLWLFVVIAIVAGGIREEVQRAFILRRFEDHLGGAMLGLVVFSLAFGAGHLLQGQDTAIVTALLGAAWGAIYLMRRSIVATGVSHAVFNVSQILGYVAST